ADAGSAIDVRGGPVVAAGARSVDGSVLVRAPRTASSLAVAGLPGTIDGAPRVILEGVRTYSDTSLNAADVTVWNNDATAWMTAAGAATADRLAAGDATRAALLSVRPGVEVVSASNLVVASDLNFAAIRPGGAAGVLTLRAAGNVTVNGHINDGFAAVPNTTTDNAPWVPAAGNSWSYRIVAGSDAAAADPMAVVASETSGDVVVGGTATNAGRQIRTGNGFIEVAAGRDVVVSNPRSAIYTAGVPDAPVPSYEGVNSRPARTWTSGGGDVRISAQRDARGATVAQAGPEWLYRDVRRVAASGAAAIAANPQQAWWVRFDRFQQAVGALGGGDVSIVAGRDVTDFSAAVPTNGRLVTPVDQAPSAADLRVQGGGDLQVVAGRDVLGGTYTVMRGDGAIVAARDIAPGNVEVPGSFDGSRLGTVLSIADAQVRLDAGRNATLAGAWNPTMLGQTLGSANNTAANRQSYFFTYSDRAAVDVRALSGNAAVAVDSGSLTSVFSQGFEFRPGYHVLPGTLRVVAFDGTVDVPYPSDPTALQLYPSTRGQLELLAGSSVSIARPLMMLNMGPSTLPGVVALDLSGATPALRWAAPAGNAETAAQLLGIDTGTRAHDPAVLHRDDLEPVRIVARDGDVVAVIQEGGSVQQSASLAKAARIVAGRDVRDFMWTGQHSRASDVSVVRAGRDVVFSTLRNSDGSQAPNSGEFVIGGEGALLVEAGRDVDLGNSNGIRSVGNANNPFLEERGAAIRVSVGEDEIDHAPFLERYLAGGDDIARSYLDRLRIVDGRALLRAQADVDGPGDTGVRGDAALALLRALPRDAQTEVVNAILFSELREGAVAFGTTGTYRRGYEAALWLYPVAFDLAGDPVGAAAQAEVLGALPPTLNAASAIGLGRGFQQTARDAYGGDLNLFFSQIKTEQGGDIDLRVPGGVINAGLANPGAVAKTAADLGVVTIRGGSIRSMSSGDFLVNQSRVFTLGGGDIALWSSFGNVDAGRGAKTAAATPPPQIVFRVDRLVLDTSRSVSGSGIGVLLSRDDVIPGDTLLAAPFGIVDAGDAGIRAAGNLTIAAALVQNALNIQVGGIASGVPVAAPPPPPPPPPPGDVAKAVAAAADAATAGAAATTAASKPSFITVRVLGLGDG
nr:filamentous hemagglutinin family protein [Burkholderiales bacterium]